MGLTHRPYIGSWRLNQTRVVQHSPDCLVYFNGDTSLPGCSTCNGRIDLQRYITQVSVECGVDSGAASANISLAIPTHTAEGMGRDGQYLLHVGLEVHVYMRGYFPMQGQYEGLNIEEDVGDLDISQIMTYPYYHVFHGVVTNVDFSRQGGLQSVTVQCNSMLHFWQYHNISQNASVFGARPANSGLKSNLVGHQYTGWTPQAIIYTLYHDIAGAAGGIGYAIKSKTNVDANSSIKDESLFSLNMEYWRRRFQTKMISLRMHGASGQVYNTAQATFLSRLSGEKVRSILKYFPVTTSASETTKFNIFSASRNLGLTKTTFQPSTGTYIVKANLGVNLVGAGESAIGTDGKAIPQAEINTTDLQPYANNVGEWGQANFYESTYQSKLDVASQVSQTTGFEFYQDVDGDFVFKPPLYNLDTSSSRVYRIESIDIISIGEHDKEPACTYMTFTGGQFRNYQISGLENEWGTRGQYVDYRLVAQFGWRPESFQSSYHNNPRTMFYAAMNRMDILNAATKSAEVSIPLRPELRPGYPVYISEIDCFYYLQNLSHSWAFGGSCTTNLNLVAKRPKFYAPGRPKQKGIQSIDLSQIYLPKKPLQVLDNDGNPRLSGFPNVVLALNPAGINPLHFITGSDFKNFNNPIVVRNLIKIALDQNLISTVSGDPKDESTGPFKINVSETSEESVDPYETQANENPSTDASPNKDSKVVRLDFNTFALGAGLLATINEQRASVSQSQERLILEFNSQIQNFITQRSKVEEVDPRTDKEREKLDQLDKKIADIEKAIGNLNSTSVAEEEALLEKLNNPQIAGIVKLLKTISSTYLKDNEDYPEANSTAAYLDLLSDKKAAFTNTELPGDYQYFSCSHPDPKQQGPGTLSTAREGIKNFGAEILDPGTVDEQSAMQQGYVNSPTRRGADGMLPEAEIGTIKTKYGIGMIVAQTDADGEVTYGPRIIPTSEIKSLVFAYHDLEKETGQVGYRFGEVFTGLPEEAFEKVRAVFKPKSKGKKKKSAAVATEGTAVATENTAAPDPAATTTPVKTSSKPTKGMGSTDSCEQMFQDNWNRFLKKVKDEAFLLKVPFPSKVEFQSREYNTLTENVSSNPVLPDLTIQNLKEARDPVDNSKLVPTFYSGSTDSEVEKVLRELFISQLYLSVSKALREIWVEWQTQLLVEASYSESKYDIRTREDEVSKRFKSLGKDLFGDAFTFRNGKKDKKVSKKKSVFASPVFPVSDRNGYEVIGSYQYGRDIDIAPNSSYDKLALQDPLAFANPGLVEEYVKALQSGQGVDDVPLPEGQLVTNVNVTKALLTVEKELAKSILENPGTSTELLNMVKGFEQQQGSDISYPGFANWVASTQDSNFKMSVSNAAYQLADLQVHVSKSICNCRAAEADIMFENAFNSENFSQIVHTEDLDQITGALSNQVVQKAVIWERNQQAIRGEVTSFGPSNKSLEESLKDSKQTSEKALGDLGALSDKASEDFGVLSDTLQGVFDKIK